MVVRELTGGQYTSMKIKSSQLLFFHSFCCPTYFLSIISIDLILESGIYFGKPRGFGSNEKGEDIGFNTEVYATHEVVFD